MKKELQFAENVTSELMLKELRKELDSPGVLIFKRLRSCSAWVAETDNYYILKSYNTMVAFIDKRTDTLYDVLRLVYGYTATSAQHISKFEKDYCRGKWNCTNRFQWRDI